MVISNLQEIFWVMAMKIKDIPVLKGEAAVRFVREADKALLNAHKIDFSAEVEWAKRILEKAKIWLGS